MRFQDIVMAAATQAGGASDPDPLGTSLLALQTAGKLVSAWYLPAPNPSQYLTLVGANVNLWTAAYGTQKVDLAVEVAAPQWDATLFSNKGGVTFNGTTQRLLGTGNVINWPDASTDLYMLVATNGYTGGANRRAFSYGDTATTMRAVGIDTAPHAVAPAGAVTATGATVLAGASGTIGAQFDIGGTSAVFVNGVSDGTVATATAALTLTRARIGANAAIAAAAFWTGQISCIAVLGPTATLTDFTNLEALMRARVA